jgi:protein SCO1/2
MATRARGGRIVAAWSVAVLGAAGLAGCGSSRPAAPSPNLGAVLPIGHPVPATPLVNQYDQPITLQSFRGKYVVLAEFLTLCQEECPLTTGALQTMQRSVQQAGLGSKVAFMEATVDPGRDTPARLRAYQTEFGANWTLLTGTSANVTGLWKHFGIFYQKVPEGKPPAIDWWTHQPLTYDVDHSNGFILVDPEGNERFVTQDIPELHGQLPANLRTLLDGQGISDLNNGTGYTIPQALDALSWLVGRRIPLASG